MILNISYDSEDWYVNILKISMSLQLQNLVCYDSEDWYVDILKISLP